MLNRMSFKLDSLKKIVFAQNFGIIFDQSAAYKFNSLTEYNI